MLAYYWQLLLVDLHCDVNFISESCMLIFSRKYSIERNGVNVDVQMFLIETSF